MTLSIHEQEDIRRRVAMGESQRKIAQETHHSRNTISKYVETEDFSPKPPERPWRVGPTMEPYAEEVESWLEGDLTAPPKQRHTAKRVYERLVKERDFKGSYATVRRFVRGWREAHARASDADGSSELVWPAGVCQIDYGNFSAVIAGVQRDLHLLAVSWPHSNARYGVATEAQRQECLVEGLQTIFEHVGRVPVEGVLDNATEAGRRAGDVVRESKLFAAFRAHTLMASTYCNPYSGNEKGSVENAVGYIRRNLLVPVPEFESIEALNAYLLSGCDDLLEKEHYKKGVPIGDLFGEDLAASLPLPSVRFDAVRWEERKADNDGRVSVDGRLYLAGPLWHNRPIVVGLRASTVELRDPSKGEIRTLPRVWSPGDGTVHEPASLLPAVSAKPRSWVNSPLRQDLPEALVASLDRKGARDVGKSLRAISDVAGACGFDNAVAAAERLAQLGRPIEPGSLGILARRLGQGDAPGLGGPDLGVYDALSKEVA